MDLKEESTYDYLVILTNAEGELNLSESRFQYTRQSRPQKYFNAAEQRLRHSVPRYSILTMPRLSISHWMEKKSLAGARSKKLDSSHVTGDEVTRSTGAARTGISLELSGTAWIDPQTGTIAKNRSRHRRHIAGRRVEISAFPNRFCPACHLLVLKPCTGFPPRRGRGGNTKATLA